MGHGFTWYSLIPGYHGGHDHTIGAIVVALLLLLSGLLAWRSFRRQEIVPSARFRLTTPFEIIAEALLKLQESIIGAGSERFLPLTGGIFIYILVCNLLGMIPGFTPPTDNFLNNFAIALVVFLAYHYYGVREHGVKYIKQFLAPVAGIGGLLLAPLFLFVESFSHSFRVVSLPLRLWGNIFADHTVLGIMESLVPFILPLPFLLLGLLVAVVQAFIFALLTMIYISLAISHDH